MPGSVKTEAVVLRSMRYGEADRILHLYTPDRGRVGAIAKGVRRTRSRFGGRLEPFFRLDAASSTRAARDLLTVTSAETVAATRGCASDGRGARRGRARAATRSRGCSRRRAASRRLPPARNELALLDGDPAARHAAPTSRVPPQAAGRRRLAPQLAACASCGEREHLVGFSGAAGGVVCGACEAGSFALDEDGARVPGRGAGRPLADAPEAGPRALRQAERADRETAEHHAHVRLRGARTDEPSQEGPSPE